MSLEVRDVSERLKNEFSRRLLNWWLKKERERLPWRETRDPYSVLVAEIMLRKTDVSKVLSIYSSFLKKYPNFESIVKASEEEIMEHLKPLGIYRYRARQLKRIAELVCTRYGGELPKNLKELIKLPGVGRYIASAIACFVWNQRVPVVDVNVIRVLSRVFNLKVGPSSHKNTKIWEFAESLLPMNLIREYNLALIDIGRHICLPSKPKCNACPLKEMCAYFSRSKSKLS